VFPFLQKQKHINLKTRETIFGFRVSVSLLPREAWLKMMPVGGGVEEWEFGVLRFAAS
jgi:hypothetical protein